MSILSSATSRPGATRVEEVVDWRFPQIHSGSRDLVIEDAGPSSAPVRMEAEPSP